jgi:hypothetical protein
VAVQAALEALLQIKTVNKAPPAEVGVAEHTVPAVRKVIVVNKAHLVVVGYQVALYHQAILAHR